MKKYNRGITLIALVVTIIVLLILAAVSISTLTGENGLLNKAGQAREKTMLGNEKETVELAYTTATVNKLGTNVTVGELQNELDIILGDGKTIVTSDGDNSLNVLFRETNNNYNIKNGIIAKSNNPSNIVMRSSEG